jgi:long-chain acyl-CoA synthetase
MLADTRLSERPWVAHYPKDVPNHLEYPQEPIYWLLEEAARRVPGRVVCRYYRQELTYAQLLEQCRRMAAALRARGLKPGDRVGILLPNIPEYLIALFGTWMAGGVTVPLNPLMVAEEVDALLRSTSCRFVVALDLFLPLLASNGGAKLDDVFVTSLNDRLPWINRLLYKAVRLRRLGIRHRRVPPKTTDLHEALAAASPDAAFDRPSPDSYANILPTGGTTGHPKAVVLTHRNLLSNAWQVFHWSGKRFGEDVLLAVLPFFHSYGLTSCGLTGVAMGATLVMHHRFKASTVLRLVERTKPTMIPAVPAMLAAFNKELRRRHYDLGEVKTCISGGAPLPPAIAAEFSERSGAVVVEGYGLSEASPVTHAGPLDGTARDGTIGLPLPDTDAMIVDASTGEGPLPPGEVGELVVRGPQVMAGYWNDPEATAHALRDGWLFTGDLATCDADGFFRIVDRKKDLIITSGVNVYPTDVEHVLRQYADIEDVAVLGVPDGDRGELVKVVVVPKDGRKFSRRAFDEFAREHLEVHKRPRVVEVVRGPLPRNPLGKVLRRVLRNQHLNGEVPAANGKPEDDGKPKAA